MLTDEVDPFLGSDPPGNCLAGPYLPLGLVRLGPDTIDPPTSGQRSDRAIVRFSHTHVSGTGGGGRYGNVGVVPFTGPPRFQTPVFDRVDEVARPGYYAVTLNPGGIRAELTCTARTGVHRYTFPGGEANLIIDASAVLQVLDPEIGVEERATCAGGFVEWISATEVVGRGDFVGGWGHHFPYSVHFYARFDRRPRVRQVSRDSPGQFQPMLATGTSSRAMAGFKAESEVGLVVGVSYVSLAGARASVDREVGTRPFDRTAAEAREIWERRLGQIRVDGGTPDQRMLFYTSLSRLFCMPTDLGVDDEFGSWRSGVRHFTDVYALWDSVRNANALITLIDPGLEVDLLNCLLDVADHTGWLPDAWIAGHSARVQGGSSADVLLWEAAAKGLTGIDFRHALQLMRRNADVESPDPWSYGRHLADYRDLGYVSTDVRTGCVSRHLEYAYQDWCIGRLAGHLGQAELADHYLAASAKLWNLWRNDLRCFAPRRPDGRWVDPFDQDAHLPDSWNDPYYYEGSAHQWSFHAWQDFPGLVRRHGGPEAFVQHLDAYFDGGRHRSKETILHVPYLYLYAGRPDLAADRVRHTLERYFRPTRDGLPDNEDMGCQSAYYVASSMGMYPVMGQDLYWLVPPTFGQTEIALGDTGRTLRIEATAAGPRGRYLAGGRIDGLPLRGPWLRHADLAGGAVLELDLTEHPTRWGEPPPAAPPRGEER